MVLVDTSVWISHLRDNNPDLASLLYQGQVVSHPLIIGELACGNLDNRQEILSSLNRLPMSEVATHTEVLEFIEDHCLMGKGLGLIDIHLLGATVLSSLPFWTRDKRLKKAAIDLKVAYQE